MREAEFQQLVCVSNVITTVQFLEKLGQAPDGLGIVFEVCRGTIRDEAWFRNVMTLVDDPEHRVRCIDWKTDWWYLDDMAQWFMERDELGELFQEYSGTRIFDPDESGVGDDVLSWLSVAVR